MKPLDLRLMRYASAARGVFLLGALLGVAKTGAIVLWSWCLAQIIATTVLPFIPDVSATVSESSLRSDQLPMVAAGAVLALVVRSLSAWAMDVVAARGAIRVKSQLRAAALDALDASPSARIRTLSESSMVTTLGRGLDALDGYFSGYVPQLILAVIVTPILIVAVFLADPVSAVTVIVVFPVIPLFMVLIGMATQAVQDRQWSQLQHLSASFLDVVTGLPTLKIFGRERRQIARIERETDEYRSRTMKVLRVTFLSGFVLDLAGTFSIALVAVTVGTRLVNGQFPLALGLFVLLLLPEVFIPIRQVGAAFHASTEGLAASTEVFHIIESGKGSTRFVPASAVDPGRAILTFEDVVLSREERTIVGPVSLKVAPGEIVALAGPSGAGKSTVLASLLGFLAPSSGTMSRVETLSWVGQRAGLLQGSIAENVALGDVDPDPELILAALAAAALPDISPDYALGASGSGLSGGQAQRVSIARCLYRAWRFDAALLLLDEPSSALDAESEERVCAALRREADAGRGVLVVSHRQAVLDAADRVVRIEAAAGMAS